MFRRLVCVFSVFRHRTVMAAPKRQHESEHLEGFVKKIKVDGADIKLQEFLTWCKNGQLLLSDKVSVGQEGSVAQYGMRAIADVAAGECLFEIPRTVLLTPESSQIAAILAEDADSLSSDSGWVPLLLALMYEYTSPASKWAPYIHLVPDFDELDLPMFWPSDLVASELKGTGVPAAVKKDLASITKEFDNIVLPFMRKHQNVFPSECGDLDLYKKMVAFVMAYSFTEPPERGVGAGGGDGSSDSEDEDEDEEEEEELPRRKPPPMMVPMADMLNHVAKNNAHLDFGKDSLVMKAVRPIKKGEEVYNTYGCLSNADLLHMYGFAEPYPDNIYDTVDIPHAGLLDSLSRGQSEAACLLLREKFNYLATDVLQEDGCFTVAADAIVTEDELAEFIHILSLDDQKFREVAKKGSWSETLFPLNDNLEKLPQKWKDVLISVMRHGLSQFDRSLPEVPHDLKASAWGALSRRRRYSALVRHGQREILNSVIARCDARK